MCFAVMSSVSDMLTDTDKQPVLVLLIKVMSLAIWVVEFGFV